MSKFPTQQNRELIGPYQGIKSAYQGKFSARSGKGALVGFPPSRRPARRRNRSYVRRRTLPRLRRYARALTRNRDRTEDLVQDTLSRALDKEQFCKPAPISEPGSLQ